MESTHPHLLERQDIKLALKIFADTTVAALKSYGPESENMKNWNGTSHFISLIWRWWCIVNVKHLYKGRNTLNKYACPVDAADHENVQFLSSMGTWLDARSNLSLLQRHREGFFIKFCYLILHHTLKVLKDVAKYLLENLNFDFVLYGKFQTDHLESRFSRYHQMYDSNRLVSV